MVKRKVVSGFVHGRGSGGGRSWLAWKWGERTRVSEEGETSGFCMINIQVEGWLCMGWFGSHASKERGKRTCKLFYTSGHAWG